MTPPSGRAPTEPVHNRLNMLRVERALSRQELAEAVAWSGSAVRNERDVEAHPILSAISVTILLVSYIGTDASRIARDLEARHLHAMFWLILLLSSALPSILLAWSEREV